MVENKIITYVDLAAWTPLSSSGTVLVVRDPVVFEMTAVAGKLSLVMERPTTVIVDAPQGLLELDSLERVFTSTKKCKPDLIIGVGGGTVLDTVKLLNVLFSTGCAPRDIHAASKKMVSAIPMVMIPTTAGTGSEATHFAVLYINKEKVSIVSSCLLPNWVILDPDMVSTMPKSLSVSTGFDALSQAIESYWSINSTVESKKFSRKALKLIKKAFVHSVISPNVDNRAEMQLAAYFAGSAINIAKTTASHALSYPLSAYFNVSHGVAVILTLPEIFNYNAHVEEMDCSDPRGVEYVRKTMNELENMLANGSNTATEWLNDLFNEFDIPNRLVGYGIEGEENLNLIIENGFNPQRMGNNPRKVTKDIVEGILKRIQ